MDEWRGSNSEPITVRTIVSREVAQSNEKKFPRPFQTYILVLYQQGKKIHNNLQHPNKRSLSVNKLTVSRLMSLTVTAIFRLQLSFPITAVPGSMPQGCLPKETTNSRFHGARSEQSPPDVVRE